MGAQNNFQSDIHDINRIPAVKNILDVVCKTTGMGFSAVARVTEEKWIACAVNDQINWGLQPGSELKIETTICNEIRRDLEAVIINEVGKDEHFANHHTPAIYGFQSYISVPIILKNGDFFGTLCAIDPKPAVLDSPEIRAMFNLFAELIAFHLDALGRVKIAENNLNRERETAEQREKFIAILGHDLRNPVGASLNAAQVLMRISVDDKAKRLARIVQDSSLRISGLIDNILDFARGRFGSGIMIDSKINTDLDQTLTQVINELKLVFPDAIIETEFNFTEPVYGDSKRIAQLFSNLLANALSHGNKTTAVKISVNSTKGHFNLCVTNNGQKIPEENIANIFKPFSRGEVQQGKKGLGLGLYISSEIAKAHKGTLKVSSTDVETCFTFEFPNKF